MPAIPEADQCRVEDTSGQPSSAGIPSRWTTFASSLAGAGAKIESGNMHRQFAPAIFSGRAGAAVVQVRQTRADRVLPDGVLPDGVLPDGVLPDGVLPGGTLPGGHPVGGRIRLLPRTHSSVDQQHLAMNMFGRITQQER